MMVAAIGAIGMCCCSGLLVIPTADTMPHGAYSAEIQADGVVEGIKTKAVLLNNQMGLGGRFEFGVDLDPDRSSDSNAIANAKCQVLSALSGRVMAAIGVSSVARSVRPAPYAVTSTDLGVCRVHLGVMRVDGSDRCIAGFDKRFGKLTAMADYTSGDGGLCSLGVNYQFTDSFGVMAGPVLHRGGEDTGFSVHLVCCKQMGGPRG